jgi:3-ketosteroid 9alpha-monooxygenase subunit B
MTPFNRMRLLHWLVAASFLLGYLSGDEGGLLHVWLGYALIAVLLLRWLAHLAKTRGFPPLLPTAGQWQARGVPLLGKLLTVLLLSGALLTGGSGLMMVDNARVLGLPATAAADAAMDGAEGTEGEMSDIAKEVHEAAANLTLLLAGLHVAYLLCYRRHMVLTMIRGQARRSRA